MNTSILAIIGAIALGGCSANVPNNAPNWSQKAIQIEQRALDGAWHEREPLYMHQQMEVVGANVGKPNWSLMAVASASRDVDGPSTMDRHFEFQCPNSTAQLHKRFKPNEPTSWNVSIECLGAQWRFSLVPATTVLRPPMAKPGDIVPMT